MGTFCMNCGTALPEGAGFCPKCGTKIEVPHCPACGKELDFGTDFCIYCGQQLKEEPPVSEPKQEEDKPAAEMGILQEEKAVDAEAPREEPSAEREPEREEPAPMAETASQPEEKREETAPPVDFTPAPDDRVFTWAYMTRQSVDRMIHTITVKIQGRTLCISEELGSLLQKTWHRSLPEKEIDLAEIRGVEVRSKKLVITEWSGKETVVKGGEPEILRETAAAILDKIGMASDTLFDTPSDVPPDTPPAITPPPNAPLNKAPGKKSALMIVGIVVGVIAALLLGITAFEEVYLKQIFPGSVMQNPDVRDYVGTEINGDLDYLVTAEVTGGKLVKSAAMPQYEDGRFFYYFLDCVYDVTVSDDYGESASGQVTVNCSFAAKPFESRPENILLNTFTYSDELMAFINEKSGTLPDDLPLEFSITGSAGGWNTFLTLYPDGSFNGGYHDMDMGVSPTIYTCTFSGAFNGIKQVNDYTYAMTVSELETEESPGDMWYDETGTLIISTEPAGVEVGETFYLYMPQSPVAELPPEFMMNWYDGDGTTLGRYGLHGKTQDFNYAFRSEELNGGSYEYDPAPDSYGDDYILPTDTQYITEYDLYGLTKEEVVLARNEIYARYGYSFQSENIRSYFAAQSWYNENPNVNSGTFGTAQMNDCERENLETIQQYERDMGWK